jgi:predicted RNase H-like HicB family nuclease
MNNTRREEIQKITDVLQDILYDIELVLSDEQEYFDNMPENLQFSERGERSEEAISNLEYTLESVQEAIENLQEAIEQ